MSDNGSAYRSYPVTAFLHQQVIEHIFTRPYTLRTNGKAERFIQTSLREWAYNLGSIVTTGTELTPPLNSKRPSNPSACP